MMKKQGITDSFNLDSYNVYKTVDKLGCVQIDTINVVERAHFITLWTRLGKYDKNRLWELTYKERRLFEYNAHAACYIPFKDFRFYKHAMEVREKEIKSNFKKWGKTDPELLDIVLDRVKEEGPISSKDFDGPTRTGGWWNWKPAKLALELFFGAGILLIDRRENFQKYYDLAEKIIPDWVDTNPPDEKERVLFFIKKTLSCLGLAKPQEIRSYYYDRSVKLERTTREIQELLDRLVSEGDVSKYEVDWDKDPYYCLTEDLNLIEERVEPVFHGVQLIGYFDNFMWNRERINLLFDFEPKLEIYVPQKDRTYGYYHFPVLYGERLVSRIEPKMDRENRKLVIIGYWLEDGFKPSEDYTNKLWENLESFALFNRADEIIWEESNNS